LWAESSGISSMVAEFCLCCYSTQNRTNLASDVAKTCVSKSTIATQADPKSELYWYCTQNDENLALDSVRNCLKSAIVQQEESTPRKNYGNTKVTEFLRALGGIFLPK